MTIGPHRKRPTTRAWFADVMVIAARVLATRRRSRILAPISHLDDHTLRDIGVADDARDLLVATRDAALLRLRAQAGGGPFFIPPA